MDVSAIINNFEKLTGSGDKFKYKIQMKHKYQDLSVKD